MKMPIIALALLLLFPWLSMAQQREKHKMLRIIEPPMPVFPFYKVQIRPFALPDSLRKKKISVFMSFNCKTDSLGKILFAALRYISFYQGNGVVRSREDVITLLNSSYYYGAHGWGKDSVKLQPLVNYATLEFLKTVRIRRKKGPPPKGLKYFPVFPVNYIDIWIKVG